MKLPSNNLNLIGLRSTGAVKVRHPDGDFEAHFENEYFEAQFSEGPSVETRRPVLTARTVDVEALEKETPLEVLDDDGCAVAIYRFKRHEPDGTGISLVYLRD